MKSAIAKLGSAFSRHTNRTVLLEPTEGYSTPEERFIIHDGDPLANRHHLEIVFEAYGKLGLGRPKSVRQYHSWSQVPDMHWLGSDALIFVDGGITSRPIDVGHAVLVNDGGIIQHPIACGFFHKDGGIIEAPIVQRGKG